MMLFAIPAAAVLMTQQLSAQPTPAQATLVLTTLNCLFEPSSTPELSVLKMNNRSMEHMDLHGPTGRELPVPAQPVAIAPAVNRFTLRMPAGNYEVYARSKWCSGKVMAVIAAGHTRSTSIALQQFPSSNMMFDHDHASVVGSVPVPGTSVSIHRYDDPSSSQPADIEDGDFYFDSLQRIRWVLEFRTGCCDKSEFGLDLASVMAGDYAVVNVTPSDVAARREYRGPIFSDAGWIAPSPAGDIWFTNSGRNSVGYISRSGAVHELQATLLADPNEITVASDGTVWFTETGIPAVGHVDSTMHVRDIDLHDEHGSSETWGPSWLKTAVDGAAWVVDPDGKAIERITPDARVQRFDMPATHRVWDLGIDASGSVWFATSDPNSIGRVTSDGVRLYDATKPIVLFDHAQNAGRYVYYLSSDKLMTAEISGFSSGSTVISSSGYNAALWPDDRDGAWYVDCHARVLGHYVGGKRTGDLQLPGDWCPGRVIGDGKDGVWFWMVGPNRLEHIAAGGEVTVVDVPGGFVPGRAVRSSDGTIWFIEHGANRIGYVANGKVGYIDLVNPGATPGLTIIP